MSEVLFEDLPFRRWKKKALLSEPSRARVALYAHIAAGNLLLLGCVEEANRIFKLLYDHDLHHQKDIDRRCINNYAWHATGLWPAHVVSPQPDKLPSPKSDRSESLGVYEDGPEFVDIIAHKEKVKLAEVLEKADPETAWTAADFRKARELATSNEMRVSRSAAAASIEIALALDQDEAADVLMREHMLPLLKRYDLWDHVAPPLQEILSNPQVWKKIVEGWIRKALDIKLSNIASFVDEVVSILSQRLENAPERPLQDQSIAEVVHVLDKELLKKQEREVEPGTHSKGQPSFLNAPASKNAIAELEAKIATCEGYSDGLPVQYKEFLRIANGTGPGRNGVENILGQVDEADFDDDLAGELELELIPFEALPDGLNVAFTRPDTADEMLDIGAGGDEGKTFLISKRGLKPAIDEFNATYENASEAAKTMLAKVVGDIYGSIEEMRNLDHIVLRWFHWNAATEVFPSVKHLLENYVREARMNIFACDRLDHAREWDDDEEGEGSVCDETTKQKKGEQKQIAGQKRALEE